MISRQGVPAVQLA